MVMAVGIETQKISKGLDGYDGPRDEFITRDGLLITCRWQPKQSIRRLRLPYYQEVTMNLTSVSVFDLSPPEKLQLVEDLWDDLAATPSEVPVHEWQKEELARRKANLMNNPASGLSWAEVKRKVRSRYGR